MPYKFHDSRRHKFPKARYRVTNWPEYDAALLRRGSLTLWFTEEAVSAWRAPVTGKRGGQPIYSATAIETCLALRLVFHQPLRQTEGLLRSIASVLELDIAIPDQTTLSRRGGNLAILPKTIDREERPCCMCGRPLGCKRKMRNLTAGRFAIMCPAFRRGAMAAGPDGVRDPVPNTDAASQAVATSGFPGSSVRPIVISFSSFTPASTRGDARHRGPCQSGRLVVHAGAAPVAVTGRRYTSPRVISAQATRAILLASATAATFRGLRKSRARNHSVISLLPGFWAALITEAMAVSNGPILASPLPAITP